MIIRTKAPVTKKEVKLMAQKILKRHIPAKEWKNAKLREKGGKGGIAVDTDEFPLRACSFEDQIRSCKSGCILQKLAFRLGKKFHVYMDEAGYNLLTADSRFLWEDIFTPRQVSTIIRLNDCGHWNKLKAFLRP